MKSILRILADIALLPVSGCIFPPNRDFSDDRSRPRDLKATERVEAKADFQKSEDDLKKSLA
jgi:hypothetical protein